MIYWIFLTVIIYIIKYVKIYTYPSAPEITGVKLISVCGVSGSGKTVFCKDLEKRHYYSILYIDCDKLFFEECIGNPAVFSKKLRTLIKHNKGNTLIFDGNYKAIRKEVWNRCDKIYYLDIHPIYRIKNVITREFWNWWNNRTNEIGRPANFPMLIYRAIIKSNQSLIWHASGLDFQKKQLDEGVISYLRDSQEHFKRHVEKRNERIKSGQTPKELQNEPVKITYLKGCFDIKAYHFESFIITVVYLVYFVYFNSFL